MSVQNHTIYFFNNIAMGPVTLVNKTYVYTDNQHENWSLD